MGFFQGYGQCTYYASEYRRDSGDTFHRSLRTDYGCLPTNATAHYWVQYINASIRMNVNTTVMATTPWSPYSYWDYNRYGPFSAQFSAETTFLGSNVPTSRFGQMQVQQFNDAWTNTLPAMYSACPWPVRYIKTSVSGNAFGLQTSGGSIAYNC